MSWSHDRFDLSTLQVGDRILASGDDFDACIDVVRQGAFPGCIMLEGDPTDHAPVIVQIIGHGNYAPDLVADCTTFVVPGFVGGGGRIIFSTFDGPTGPELHGKSLTRWKVLRDDVIVYNRGETKDETGDADVPEH